MTSDLKTRTLGEMVVATGGRSSGFDYLRIGLAVAVALSHVGWITYGGSARVWQTASGLDAPLRAILPMFFALSGFLVSGSLERTQTITAFVGLRMIRIVPALAVEILLSALILGPLLTTLPWRDYFSDVLFRQYFLNVVGEIHFYLPGLFQENPGGDIVNSQLWTIPYELGCYLCLTMLAVVGIKRWRALAPILLSGTMVAYILYWGMRHGWQPPAPAEMSQTSGLFLVWSFLAGVSLHRYRDKIKWSVRLFVVAALISAVGLELQGYWGYITPFTLAYVTVFIGLTNVLRLGFLRGADFSYGLYLYHWAVMQTVVSVVSLRHWVVTLFIGIPIALLVAALSWRFIEEPALRLRTPIMAGDHDRGGILVVTALAIGALLGFSVCLHLVPLLWNYTLDANPLGGW